MLQVTLIILWESANHYRQKEKKSIQSLFYISFKKNTEKNNTNKQTTLVKDLVKDVGVPPRFLDIELCGTLDQLLLRLRR